jgi:class 3 adenylate cyclase
MTVPDLPRTTFRGFLFADLRGYSDYVERHGDHAAIELLSAYRTLVRSIVERYEGAEIRTEGDSFFIVFQSASRAVSCGMEIAARAMQAEPPIRVGVGIHAGEAADSAEGPVGSAVNIAARVCAQAGAGEVVVTDMVRALTRTLVPYRFDPRGTPTLKGIVEPMPLFQVVERSEVPVGPEIARPAGRRMVTRRMGLAVSTIVVAIVALGLGAGALIAFRPTAPPSPAISSGAASAAAVLPSTAGAPSAPTASSGLTSAEQDLVSRLAGLSPEERASCRPGTSQERASGAVTGVTCLLAPGQGATSAHYDLFDQTAIMLTAFDAYARAHGDPGADCATSEPGGGTWDVPHIAQGHVLCFAQAGSAQIIWTYEGGEGAGIMGSAVREDGDSQRLYDWWQETHPLIAH